jgi:hypothetical protein
MIRAATPEGIVDVIGWLVTSLLIGALAGRIAKHFGAPIEPRVLAFIILATITMVIWYVGRKSDATAPSA